MVRGDVWFKIKRMSKILTKGKFSDKGYKAKAGNCPHCGEKESLDYGVLEVVDEQVFYPWTCFKCEGTGQEWYNLEFYAQSIDD